MNLPTLFILLGVAALLGLVIFYFVRVRRKGGCASCAGCPHSGSCADAHPGGPPRS